MLTLFNSNEPATGESQQKTSIERGGLIQSAYGASSLPLDFLSGASGKFWTTNTENVEEVIAGARALDIDAMRRRRSKPTAPPPAARASPFAHDQEKESKFKLRQKCQGPRARLRVHVALQQMLDAQVEVVCTRRQLGFT